MNPEKDESPENLRQTASRARDRLARTLDALDRRRHDIFNIKGQLHKHAVPLVLVSAGTALVLAGSGAVALYRTHHRRERLLSERVQALVRFWRYPERVARQGERSIPAEIGRRVLMGLSTTVLLEFGRQVIKKIGSAGTDAVRGPNTPMGTG